MNGIYHIKGFVQIGVFTLKDRTGTFDYQAWDVGYFPLAMKHRHKYW